MFNIRTYLPSLELEEATSSRGRWFRFLFCLQYLQNAKHQQRRIYEKTTAIIE